MGLTKPESSALSDRVFAFAALRMTIGKNKGTAKRKHTGTRSKARGVAGAGAAGHCVADEKKVAFNRAVAENQLLKRLAKSSTMMQSRQRSRQALKGAPARAIMSHAAALATASSKFLRAAKTTIGPAHSHELREQGGVFVRMPAAGSAPFVERVLSDAPATAAHCDKKVQGRWRTTFLLAAYFLNDMRALAALLDPVSDWSNATMASEILTANSFPASLVQPWHKDEERYIASIVFIIHLIKNDSSFEALLGSHSLEGWRDKLAAATSSRASLSPAASAAAAAKDWAEGRAAPTATTAAEAAALRAEGVFPVVLSPSFMPGDLFAMRPYTYHRGLPNAGGLRHALFVTLTAAPRTRSTVLKPAPIARTTAGVPSVLRGQLWGSFDAEVAIPITSPTRLTAAAAHASR